jgi:Nif-specific regulatory protein
VDRRDLELTALYEISKVLGSSLNLVRNLRSAMRVLADYLDMQRGTVALMEDAELVIKAAHGLTDEEAGRGRYRPGEGIMGRVAATGTPVVIPDVGTEPLFLDRTGARRIKTGRDITGNIGQNIDRNVAQNITRNVGQNIKRNVAPTIAFICLPIKYRGKVLGVLSADRLQGAETVSFDRDLNFLKIVAVLVAQAVKLSYRVEEERRGLIEEKEILRGALKGRYRLENVIGGSDGMQEVFEAVHRVSQSRATALLLGESGTGKELIAKAIHYMGKRADRPFIKLNCASIPEGLLEAELFGHEKGAFSGAAGLKRGRFELADRGTIFLDEIADLSPSLQPKILRVLQEREFERVGGEVTLKIDVRVVAATSRDLDKMVAEGKFRQDLYYRLNVVPIKLPPLRERKMDIPELADHFLKKFNKENSRKVRLSPEAVSALTVYDWPGNVRELENIIERVVIMSAGDVLRPRDLPLVVASAPAQNIPAVGFIADGSLTQSLSSVERRGLVLALEKSGWVGIRAARELGITQRQIGYKMKKYGITRPV